MSDEIYSPPSAELSSVVDTNIPRLREFYIVSERKFTILFFGTLGYYIYYWFYRQWKAQKKYHRDDIWPVPRSIFNIFFTHSLIYNVEASLSNADKKHRWSPGALATTYVLAQIVSGIIDRISMSGIGSPWSDMAALLFLPIIYGPIFFAQRAINIAEEDPSGEENARLSAANILWMIPGIGLWVLILIGIFVVFGEQ